MIKHILFLACTLLLLRCNEVSKNDKFNNMTQDEIYVKRIEEGSKSYTAELIKIDYHHHIHSDEDIYKRIAENFNDNGSMALYFMGTSGFDSENDGIYKDMFMTLQKSVNHKFELKNYKESDKFYNSKNELTGQYQFEKDAWDSNIVNSSTKQLKTISFELNDHLYEKEFEQYTDMVNYNIVIEELLNGALRKEGFKEEWYMLPSIDQTYNVIFTSKEFYEKLNDQGYIGTEKYYNSLEF